MTMSFLSFFTTLFFFVLVVNASPIRLVAKSALDVYVPKPITPKSSTVWTIGQKGEVTWDASNAPKNISNGAYIELSRCKIDTELPPCAGGRKYTIRLPEPVDLRAGKVTVNVPTDNVPAVEPGTHFITLFGDSGNYSPLFTINK